MTHEEARCRLERSTEFRFDGERVRVRDPRWLRAIESVRRADVDARSVPTAALRERVA
jgi:hypothetical protein